MIEQTALDAIADVCRLERELLEAQVMVATYREMFQLSLSTVHQRDVQIKSLEVQLYAVREEIRSYVRSQVCS